MSDRTTTDVLVPIRALPREHQDPAIFYLLGALMQGKTKKEIDDCLRVAIESAREERRKIEEAAGTDRYPRWNKGAVARVAS